MHLRLLSKAPSPGRAGFVKTLLIMKLTTILLLSTCLQLAARGYSQKITLSQSNVSLKAVFRAIEKQSDYQFFYKEKLLKEAKNISIKVSNASIEEVLAICLNDQPLSWSLVDKIIVIKKQAPVVSKPQELPPPPVYIPITGVIVSDSTGQPLSGVSVKLKGTSTGTYTDNNGNFNLQIPDGGGTLVISSIGYESQEVRTTGSSGAIRVRLKLSATKLNEIVIVGYTTQEKRKLTSAVVSVSGEEMTKRVATDPTSLLQGQLPGVSVLQNSAEPGNESMKIRIRGLTTFSPAGTDPLVIVDGIPGNLSTLNPNDIESVTVLKDAASAAIYGSRGANGVIVVKTKKGKSGGFTLTYNYNVGIAKATRLPRIITNSAEYMQLLNEAYKNSTGDTIYTQAQIDLYKNATDRVKYPNHDWLGDMFRTVAVQNHYLNLSGGREGTTYSLGLGYTDQPGTMLGFSYKKYTLDFGLSSRVNKRVTLGTNIQVRYGDRTLPGTNSSTDLYISALSQSPLFPARTPDGKWYAKAYQKELGNKNPVLVATQIPIRNPDYYGQGNMSLDIDLIKGLKWENRAGISFDVSKSKVFVPTIPMYYYNDLSSAGNFNGNLGLSTGENDDIHTTFYSQLNYKRSFGSHNLSVLGGAQQEVDNYSWLNAFRTGYPTNSLTELDAGSPNGQTNNGTSGQWIIRSYYGSLNYDYDDKYLFGSSIRYDGTSRLPKDSRWGLFYAFSGAWRISKEAFLKDVMWLNDLKIRGSWGKIGNQNIGTYPYQRVLDPNSYAFAGNVLPGATASATIDPSLTWETTRVFDLGADISVFNNKLTFSADWFNKYTYDILRTSQVAYWLGLQAPTVNNGAVRNRGFELSVRYQDKIGRDFNYYVAGNFQTYRNKLVSFGKDEITGPDGQTIMRNGQPINSFYLYVADGIFQSQDDINKAPDQSSLGGAPTPGDIKYKDITGDNKVDANDRQLFSGQYPKFEYSLTMGGNWKGFDASVQLYGSQGNKLYLYKWGVDPFAQGAPPTVDWRNRWTPQHPSTTMPKIYMGFYGYPKITNFQSTFHLYDASFMRIKNLQLGYTFSGRLLREVKNLRLYVSVDNLALFTPLKQGTDPERLDISNKPDAWYGFANYPQNRTFTFGASVQF